MSGSRPSYIGRRPNRQSAIGEGAVRQSPPFFRAAVLAAVLLTSAGCARLGLPGAGTVDPVNTGAIKTAVTDGVAPSDWEVVRQTIARADTDVETVQVLAWENPQTGSYGTLNAKADEARADGICRVFSTTVNDLRGVRRYRGEACRPQGSNWKLTGIAPDDSKLL